SNNSLDVNNPVAKARKGHPQSQIYNIKSCEKKHNNFETNDNSNSFESGSYDE
ncbi:17606_t:CDS:2, partial [Racocetra fulgida]